METTTEERTPVKTTTPPTTCQICGRNIKSKSGLIAHHGYHRPGQGWQTASCMGARYRPYEVASDALPIAIDSCDKFIHNTTRLLKEWNNNPPPTIKHRPKYKSEDIVMLKPENFDPATVRDDYRQYSYVHHYLRRRHELQTEITYADNSLKYLKKRLADWKPPVT